ncbi:helix-turn-helix domain-containing protein [Paenochrobactrum sp. BZR 588]|uniref:helix-turn-helix domain-containing protein n=1 Tax=Paenochrobactrum TaxID=999488 RepID=UPI0035BC0840
MNRNVTLSTDMIDLADRDEFWRDVSKIIYDVSPVVATQGLAGSVISQPFGEMILGATSFNSQYCQRTRRNIMHDPLDSYIVQLVLSGPYKGDFNGTSMTVCPGDIFFLDLDQPLDSKKEKGRRLSLVIPRCEIQKIIPNRNLHGQVLTSNRGTTKLLSHYIKGIAETLSDIADDETEAVQNSVLSLISEAFNGIKATRSLNVELPLRSRILGFIEHNISDPTFGLHSILSQFPVSRSSLYRAFEEDGGIANLIRQKRLDHAFKLLTSRQKPAYSVKDVVRRVGFTEGTQFARFFRARFGIQPNEALALKPSLATGTNGFLALHEHLTQRISNIERSPSMPITHRF